MASPQLVCFPGWDALRVMSAEKVQELIMSYENPSTARYLSMVGPSHRGSGAIAHHEPPPQQRVSQARGDDADRRIEYAFRDAELPPPYPGALRGAVPPLAFPSPLPEEICLPTDECEEGALEAVEQGGRDQHRGTGVD